jgi:hypothetical protein
MKEIPGLVNSKPDLQVAIEMMHVREWERLYHSGRLDDSSASCDLKKNVIFYSDGSCAVRVLKVSP